MVASSSSPRRGGRPAESKSRAAKPGRPRAAPSSAPSLPARLDARLDRLGPRVVVVAIALYALIYLIVCAIKYRDYLYKDFDLAIFVQATDRILHGTTFSSIRGMSWLGDHSSLVLFLLAPLWAVAPHPFTLLAVQTLALALGAWPLYRLARRTLPGGTLPVTVALLYLMYPAVGYTNLFEFHPETLATGALLALLDAFDAGRLRAALLWAALALSCREDVALPVMGIAVLAALPGRARRVAFAAGLAGLALLSIAVTFAWLKPTFNSGEAEYGRMYAAWGSTPASAILHLLTHPLQALAALTGTPDNPGDTLAKREYPLHLLLPLLGLPLLAPLQLLPALPVVLEHFWSERRPQHTIVFQYTALVTPFLMSATVAGMRRLVDWRRGAGARTPPPWIAPLALIASVACNVLFGPLFGMHLLQRVPRNEAIVAPEYERTLDPYRERMLARVPREGGVVAGFEFLARLARRDQIYSIHHILTGRYTYSDRPYPIPRDVRAVLADMAGQIPNLRFDSGQRMGRLLSENDLHPVDAAGSLLLFLRGARDSVPLLRYLPPRPDTSAAFITDGQLAFYDADPLPDSVARGALLPIRTRWRRVGPATRQYLMQVRVYHEGDFTRAAYGRNRPIAYGLLPLADWPADSLVEETYRLEMSTILTPGVYRVALLPQAEDSLAHPVGSQYSMRHPYEGGEIVNLGTVRVFEDRGH